MIGKANLLRWPAYVLCLLMVLCTAATGEVIYVDDDADGNNDGLSWENAFTDLQDAIAVAREGDEIRVAQGVYTPTRDPLDRDATFDLKDGVTITGSYAGLAGMYPDFRHTKFFTTILSGDIDNNDDIMDPNSKDGNSHHVVTCAGQDNAAILEGVTITGGYSNIKGGRGGHGREFGAGGGLYCQSACSPQLIDCIFTENYAEGGGAVSLPDNYGLIDEDVSDERSWKPVFIRCIFTDNYADGGGAVSSGHKWHPEFINCLFENNNAERSAGAISSDQGTTIKFNHCVFRRNSAGRSGGAISTPLTGCEMQFFNCLFENNNAGFDGGALYSGRDSMLEFNHCTFRRNSAGRKGGAIYTNIMAEVRIMNCLFAANMADEFGGAIACPNVNDGLGRSSYKLINSTFYGNTSPCFYKPPTNVVIRPDNSREYYSASIISNCIFYNSIANETYDLPISFDFGHSEPLIITSIYEKEPSQDGIIPPTPDPLFVAPSGADGILGTEDDDFSLAPGSPAIDSGTNETFFPLPAMDLDGNPRILNNIVDLGAYEFSNVINMDKDARHIISNNFFERKGK